MISIILHVLSIPRLCMVHVSNTVCIYMQYDMQFVFAGFRSSCSKIEIPPASIPSESDLEDHSPDPHDNELNNISDKKAMDEAVKHFHRWFG
jgi:hypothetical protein